MPKIILWIILLSIIPGRSYCFEDKEHRILSANAFMLALIHSVNTNGLIDPAMANQLKSCFVDDNNENITYGKLSELPDYVADPSELIKIYTSHSNAQKEFNCVETKKNIFYLIKKGLAHALSVAQHNSDHFQGGPLIKFNLWHNLALQYSTKKNLTVALVLNAFATHYLEDFFASGHILTPRSDVNNIISRALHNVYNLRGNEIIVTEETIQNLRVYLISAKLFNGDPDSKGQATLKEVCTKEILENITGKGFIAIEEDIKKLKEYMTEYGVNSIEEKMKIFGDGELKKSPGQRELIIYMVAETISAILKAYQSEKLPEPIISSYSRKTYRSGVEINASYDGVSYNSPTKEIDLQDPLGIGQHWIYIVELTPYLSTSFKQGISPRFGVEIDMANYFMPSLSEVAESNKNYADRFFDRCFFGVAYGLDLSRDAFEGRNFSWGPLMKLIIDDRDLPIGLSFYAKYIFNDENGHKFKSVPWGGRLSFNLDYCSLFFGVGTETRYDNGKEDVITFYSGITIRTAILFYWLEDLFDSKI